MTNGWTNKTALIDLMQKMAANQAKLANHHNARAEWFIKSATVIFESFKDPQLEVDLAKELQGINDQYAEVYREESKLNMALAAIWIVEGK